MLKWYLQVLYTVPEDCFTILPYYSTTLIISRIFLNILPSFNVNEIGSNWVQVLLYLNIVLSWPEDGRLRPKHVARYNVIVIIASCLMYVVYWRCIIHYTNNTQRDGLSLKKVDRLLFIMPILFLYYPADTTCNMEFQYVHLLRLTYIQLRDSVKCLFDASFLLLHTKLNLYTSCNERSCFLRINACSTPDK
jgi:hypothetical protein